MIDFQPLTVARRKELQRYFALCGEKGCEYTFTNLFLWGRQKAAVTGDYLVIFSQFDRRSLYPFPVGQGDIKPVLDAIIADAQARGIVCRLSGLSKADCDLLESLYPGQFCVHTDRNSFDYVYDIHDLADLKGRKYQQKRNHAHRFWNAHPEARLLPIDENTVPLARDMAERWYAVRTEADPHTDFHMERVAISKALSNWAALELEGLLLLDGDEVLGLTIGSRLSETAFDVHFEKAWAEVEGSYAAINQAFARYLRNKHPELQYLNREDDMGLEGLRKAKLSYSPHHMVEKFWVRLVDEAHGY